LPEIKKFILENLVYYYSILLFFSLISIVKQREKYVNNNYYFYMNLENALGAVISSAKSDSQRFVFVK